MDRRTHELATDVTMNRHANLPDHQMLPTGRTSTLIELNQDQIDSIVLATPGGIENLQDIYPLSPLQEGMLFQHLRNESDTYVASLLFSVQPPQRLDALIAALQRVIDRHDILRSAVHWEGLARPVQVVYRRAVMPVQQLSLDSGRDPIEQLKERFGPQLQKLNLRQAPLAQLQVAANAYDETSYALFQVHHLVTDHQSLRLLMTEAVACLEGREQSLPPPPPYRLYVEEILRERAARDSAAFFRNKLGEIREPTAPFGILDVHGDEVRVHGAHLVFDQAFSQQVRANALRLRVSAARLFHAAWGLVVARITGLDDVVYGTVLLAIPKMDVQAQHMLGMRVNTLPLRLSLGGITAEELVLRTHRELIQLAKHGHTPLTLALQCSGVASGAPLFTSVLNFRHRADDLTLAHIASAGIRSVTTGIRLVAAADAVTNYPITVAIDDFGDRFAVHTQTDSRIDPQRVASYLKTALQSLVVALNDSPQIPALSLSILPEVEQQQITVFFNATQAEHPRDKLIHVLFEEQVQLTPDTIAVEFNGQSLTYVELNERANQLAWRLAGLGVRPDQLVGICVERSLEMVVGFLGILKAGGAYVPLDPGYPTERLAYMLEDAAPKVLLIQEHLRQRLPSTSAELIVLDRLRDETGQQAKMNPEGSARARHLAYVIYTSGSTGVPKGVMIEHASLLNYLHWAKQTYRPEEGQGTVVASSLAFDATITSLYLPLLCGRTVTLVRDGWELEGLETLLREQRIWSLIKITPAHLSVLGQHWDHGWPCHVGAFVIGGDVLAPSTVELWQEIAPRTRLINEYGPTETVVGCSSHAIPPHSKGLRQVSIGRPIDNVQIYILDRYGYPVPVGVMGELYIGGAGVGRGYLNRPELTAERFVADPFSAEQQARLYRTGDLGRWRADGTIEYMGRNDEQVKIRGFRIELGEIEAQLLRHVQVKEAAVLAREDAGGDKRLVAYLIARDIQAIPSAEELRTHLKGLLPEYMMPSAFAWLEKLPLTPNGKVDRRALSVSHSRPAELREYLEPRTDMERTLADIWTQLLPVNQVGVHDNFFELGGHSLLIMQMTERLRRVGLTAEIRSVFESPTLADLARTLSRAIVGKYDAPRNLIPTGCELITPPMLPLIDLQSEHIERIVQSVPGGTPNIKDIYPLIPLQEGMLFHHLFSEQKEDPYARSLLLSLPSREAVEGLIAALQTVIDRHDILRTAILWDDLPDPVQVVYRRATLPVEEVELQPSHDPSEELKKHTMTGLRTISLRTAPLMRLVIAGAPHSERWYASLQTHHLVLDNETMQTMFSEVLACINGRSHELPNPVPFRNYVAQILAYAHDSDTESFFLNQFRDIDEPTAPFGLLDLHNGASNIEKACVSLPATLSTQIRTLARRSSVSAATLFHVAWSLVIARTTARHDIVFGTVLSGRLQGIADAQEILGTLINTLPLRLKLKHLTVTELVQLTQNQIGMLLKHEHASLAKVQRSSGLAGRTPLFSTLLNYVRRRRSLQSELSATTDMQLISMSGVTNYPIVLSVYDCDNEFSLELETDTRIDPHQILGHVLTSIRSLMQSLDQDPSAQALSLSTLPDHEIHQITRSFNASTLDYPTNKLMHELFEEQARRIPDSTAAVHEGHSLTYSDLNARANQLARYLRSKEVCAEQLIGIYLERGLDIIVSILATLKTGGAYVPLDPDYPTERLQHMINDSGVQLILTHERLKSTLAPTTAEFISLDGIFNTLTQFDKSDLAPCSPQLTPRNLAYVIYTSGSTAKPKGVLVEHGNLVASTLARIRFYDAYHKFLLVSPFAFDSSVAGIFGTLASGGTLHIATAQCSRDPSSLLETIREGEVTDLLCIPSLYQNILALTTDSNFPPTLRRVVVAGEACVANLLETSAQVSPNTKILNEYGPTESTVWATVFDCSNHPHNAVVPIGTPIANTQIYILDVNGQVAPIGVQGEIYVGGAGVSRGYLNRPDLTAERFLADPFSADPSRRLYRTGDLGRWRSDGVIEWISRTDTQVKIRGFRIELSEIEACLLCHGEVREAVVLSRDSLSGDKQLVAYVTLARVVHTSTGLAASRLRDHLSIYLPDYMMPSAIVILEQLPLTPNGKLDRAALPEPTSAAYVRVPFEEPKGDVEQIIAGIWQELLPVGPVGRRDNFFELGGHSLLATRVTSRVRERFQVEIPVKTIFDAPTVSEFSIHVEHERHARISSDTLWTSSLAQDLSRNIDGMSDDEVITKIKKLEMELRESNPVSHPRPKDTAG